MLLFSFFVIQCSDDVNDSTDDGPIPELPVAEPGDDFNNEGIEYDWESHSWQGIDMDSSYGISRDGISSPILIREGNRTSYSVDGEYYRVRIPVADITKEGTIIVVSEGRLGDNPDVDPGTDRDWDHVLISRSKDFGSTWETQVIYTGNNNTDFGAIAICTDKKNDGRIQILGTYQGGMLIMQSLDDGVTWTEHHQSGPVLYSDYDGKNIRMRPKNGIQISGDNQYNGDFFLAGITGYNEEKLTVLLRYDFETDQWVQHDTLNNAENAEIGEEITLVELEGELNGVLKLISRPSSAKLYKQELHYRITDNTIIQGWSDSFFSYVRCNQNAKRYSSVYGNQESRIIYSSTKNVNEVRYGGNISISYDEGNTWLTKQILSDAAYFGYSQIVVLPDGSVGCIYEGTNSSGFDGSALYFKRFTIGWLTSGNDFGLKN